MAVRFKTSRFHVLYGPEALFERVKFKFQGEHSLKLHGKHYKDRVEQRSISKLVIEQLHTFNLDEWNLVTVEVRNDTGKFVNSTWERVIQKEKYWITIGFGDVVQTIVKKDSEGLGFDYIKSGPIFNFVSEVNQALMLDE
ncbi:hypothetical protein IM538_14830 [Cytobacillus suaedae]|nr:hypothetical protein IM538_14830 [Cytobacillus suaedae]